MYYEASKSFTELGTDVEVNETSERERWIYDLMEDTHQDFGVILSSDDGFSVI